MSSLPLLALETSGSVGSVALLDESGRVRTISFGAGMIHGVAVAPSVEALLVECGLEIRDLAALGVGCGPGSYTGTRVGVAFAKSLAFATGLPVAGVSSLRAMAAAAPEGTIAACVRDARRETLYLGVYRAHPSRPEPVLPDRLVSCREVRGLLPAGALLIGDGVARYPDLLSGEGRSAGDPALGEASAGAVARLAAEKLSDLGPDDPHELSPRYLRPTEAEENWDRREAE